MTGTNKSAEIEDPEEKPIGIVTKVRGQYFVAAVGQVKVRKCKACAEMKSEIAGLRENKTFLIEQINYHLKRNGINWNKVKELREQLKDKSTEYANILDEAEQSFQADIHIREQEIVQLYEDNHKLDDLCMELKGENARLKNCQNCKKETPFLCCHCKHNILRGTVDVTQELEDYWQMKETL